MDARVKPAHDTATMPSPPRAGAGFGFGLAVVDQGHAVERAVERGEDAPLDEIESRRLPIARARPTSRGPSSTSSRSRGC